MASAIIAKASRITKGLDSSNAGCTIDRKIQITTKTPANPRTCQRMSEAVKMRRSAKNAHGITSAIKNTMPRTTSFCVDHPSNWKPSQAW